LISGRNLLWDVSVRTSKFDLFSHFQPTTATKTALSVPSKQPTAAVDSNHTAAYTTEVVR